MLLCHRLWPWTWQDRDTADGDARLGDSTFASTGSAIVVADNNKCSPLGRSQWREVVRTNVAETTPLDGARSALLLAAPAQAASSSLCALCRQLPSSAIEALQLAFASGTTWSSGTHKQVHSGHSNSSRGECLSRIERDVEGTERRQGENGFGAELLGSQVRLLHFFLLNSVVATELNDMCA